MKNQYKKGILIAFGELFLKSEGVQKIFRRKLEQDILFFLGKENVKFKIISSRERIFVLTDELKKAVRIIKDIFGIAWLAESFFMAEPGLNELGRFIDKNYNDWVKKGETFAIRLKSGVGLDRGKIIERIARNINRKVDLDSPGKELFIEMRKSGSFVYFKKQKGAGGLPTESSGKALVLMSGGIDSPVAAYSIARRGAGNIWLHFHSFPLVSNKSIEKTKELARAFLGFQPRLKVYFAPFAKAQAEIRIKARANCRILLYRRLMLRVAELIARKENCNALVTGESLGQVSSQTLPNLKIIEEAVKIPVLRPLIGQDKEEIIKTAKKIGTFDISIRPQEDCCTLFTPKHSTAAGKLEEIKGFEKKIGIKKMIGQIIKEAKVEIY